MRSKILSVVFVVMFATSLFVDCEVYAKSKSSSGGGSGSSSSSGSKSSGSSSSSSGSYGNSASKPGSSSGSPSSAPSSGSGYGNSSTKPSSSGTPAEGSSSKGSYGNSATSASGGGAGDSSKSSASRSPVQDKMNRSFSKQESAKAYESYTANQAKFQKGTSGTYNPAGREQTTINSVRGSTSFSSTDYYSRRTVFYDTYRWQPPIYIYHSYSSFGIWDGMMLWFMLDHINDRQYAEMYYHHQDDPGMQQFRKELDRLSTENAELKAKVKQLDESSKTLEQQGVKADPAYVPPDAAGIALAANIVDKTAPKEKSGFPWGWVIIIGVLGLLGFLLMRRKR